MTANNLITIERDVYDSLLEELAQLRKVVADSTDELNFQRWNYLLEGIISATSSLLNPDNFDASVNDALAKLGNVFDVDRVYVIKTHSQESNDQLSIHQSLRWYSSGIPSKVNIQSFCSQDFLELCYNKLSVCAALPVEQRSSISGCTRNFPSYESQVLESQCVLSVVVIPIVVENKFWGFIGFDDCYVEKERSPREVSLLLEFANNLAAIITRYETQNRLQELQRSLRSIIDSIPQSIYWKDNSCVYQGCNLNGAKSAGFTSPKDIIGKTEYDMPWAKDKADEYYKSDLEVMRSARQELNIVENLYLCRVPLLDNAGVLVTVEDITQVQQTQNSSSGYKEDLRILIDNVYDAIFIHNIDGSIIDVNQQMLQMYEVDREDAIKLSFFDDYFGYDNDLGKADEIWQDIIAGKNQVFEWKAKKPFKDEFFYVEVVFSRINLNSQDVVLANVRDITNRKLTEAKLQQLNEELEARVEVRTLQLIQSESRLRNLTNSTPGVIYEFCRDFDGSISFLYLSSGCEEILGLTPQALQDNIELFLSTIHPEDLRGFHHSIGLSAESLDIWEYEWRSTTPDFRQKWLRGMSRPQQLSNDNIVWYGYIFDISDSKAIEAELQRSQQLLQLVMDNIPQSIFWKDCDNSYLGCNLKFALDANIDSPEDIVGKTDYQLGWTQEEAQIYRRRDRAIMNADSPQLHVIEVQKQSDGRKLWLDVSKIPLHDRVGNVVGLLGCIEDISDRKEIEACLLESEVKFRSIVETANDIIYILNPEKVVSYVSPNWKNILGHDTDEVIDQPFAAFIHHDDLSVLLDAFSKLTVYKRIDGVEHRLTHENQTYRWYTSNLAAVRDEDGNILYFTAIARDITERREAEILLKQQKFQLEEALQKLQLAQAQLIQNEKMSSLGQMVAGVAHEINNPVSFIYSNLLPAGEYIQSLLEILELYEQHYPYPVKEIQEKIAAVELDFLKEDLIKILHSMEVGTERIREIVISLRNFSRLDEAEFKCVDIHKGIDSTLLILCNALKGKNQYPEIEVIKEYASLPPIDCYPGKLNQVFMNILTNAIDALNDDLQNTSPQIYISTTVTQNNSIQIAIADNGMGIPREIQPKLFDPFFTTKKVGKGTGLGLSISYQIVVDKHGGKLYCQSVRGKGAQFFLEIPIRQSLIS
ncbi:MAG: PAS domain S-box protein [Mastigocoleus sp.]